ncbi:hypothetical protein V8F20_008438 [Naviculisporaceae sp. PSN 640]
MPLHLLGKKSWNVYNAENIARVQRDEAAARAREEAQEQRMQEHDAKVRLALLRGETPPPPPPEEDEQLDQGTSGKAPSSSRRETGAGGRKRKRAGEDDTDFEMRIARERAELGDRVTRELGGDDKRKASSREITLVDSAGHISLFEPPPEDKRKKERNPEYEREAAEKKREQEDQYRMRLVNAAGKNGLGLTDGGPWYAAPDGDSTSALVAPSKDVFGRDDPGRKAREAARLDASDPLAMMKMGAAKVRQLDKERRKVNDEREEELRALRKEERRREKEKERTRRREKEEGARSGMAVKGHIGATRRGIGIQGRRDAVAPGVGVEVGNVTALRVGRGVGVVREGVAGKENAIEGIELMPMKSIGTGAMIMTGHGRLRRTVTGTRGTRERAMMTDGS